MKPKMGWFLGSFSVYSLVFFNLNGVFVVISENFHSGDVNRGSFAVGSNSSGGIRPSKAIAVAAKHFSEEKIATAKIMGQRNVGPSENELELRDLAQAFILREEFDAAEEEASKISDVSTKELVFVELAKAAFKKGEFQRAEAVARRISTPQLWERILSIFLEFKPSVLPKQPAKSAPCPILRQLGGPPAFAGKRGSFGSIEILTDHRVRSRDRNAF